MSARPRGAATESSRRDALFIQFARAPVVGSVKTRMFPVLTPEQACALHRDLMCWTCGELLRSRLADVELWLSEDSSDPAVTRCIELGVGATQRQQGADIGQRMLHAIRHGLERYRRVILIGSDCPGINYSYLHSALAALEKGELVIGPAADGGYVLLGGRCIDPALFAGVPWGSEDVFAVTAERADALALDWQALSLQVDIDRPEDLPAWEAVQRANVGGSA